MSTRRVWREGVLAQRMCIAKTTEMYFTAEEARQPCGTVMLMLPNFWMWNKTGDLDARICDSHAAMVVLGRGYLSDQVRSAVNVLQNSR